MFCSKILSIVNYFVHMIIFPFSFLSSLSPLRRGNILSPFSFLFPSLSCHVSHTLLPSLIIIAIILQPSAIIATNSSAHSLLSHYSLSSPSSVSQNLPSKRSFNPLFTPLLNFPKIEEGSGSSSSTTIIPS
jgi:hypothetical protein